jgi:hypothetical protein
LPERLPTLSPQLSTLNHLVSIAELEADLGGGVVVDGGARRIIVYGIEYGDGAAL